jgi:hypothetical protein
VGRVVRPAKEGEGIVSNANGRRFRRAILIVGALGLGALLMPAAAWAAPGGTGHTVSMTEISHGTFDPELTGPIPCSGADIVSVDATGNTVFHDTFFPGGDEYWVTGTETGKVTLVDENDVTYTGHITLWFGSNWNEKNENNTFTFSLVLKGSDGSTLIAHEVQHFAVNAIGVVTVDFDTMSLTCG